MTDEERDALVASVRARVVERQAGGLSAGAMASADETMALLEALDEARAQLAALHAAASRFRDAVSDDGFTCRDNGIDSAEAVEEEWEAIDRVLADLATAAAEHERRIRADERAKALREERSPCCNAAIRCGRCGHDLAHVAAGKAEVSP